MRRLHTSILILILMVLATSLGFAETISKPHTFAGGTKAFASQVNANFDTVYNRVNQLNRLVVKDDGVEIGTFIGVRPSRGGFDLIEFITSKGYIATLDVNYLTGDQGLTEWIGVNYVSSNCTGTPYMAGSFAKQVYKIPGRSISYVPAGSALILVTFNSVLSDQGCYLNDPPQTQYAYALSPNDENITGVPDSGYDGPFSIDIE